MNWESWKRRARRLKAQTYTLYLAYRHPRTPWYAKVFAALIVGYVFSPIDPIPDFIPGVGLLDEMVVVPIGVVIAAKMIPQDVFEECREKAWWGSEGRDEFAQMVLRWWASQSGGTHPRPRHRSTLCARGRSRLSDHSRGAGQAVRSYRPPAARRGRR